MTRKSRIKLDVSLLDRFKGTDFFTWTTSDIFFRHDDYTSTDNDLSDNPKWVYVPYSNIDTTKTKGGYGEFSFDSDANPNLSNFLFNYPKPIPHVSLFMSKKDIGGTYTCLTLKCRISIYTGLSTPENTAICQYKITYVEPDTLSEASLYARKLEYRSPSTNSLWDHFKSKLKSTGDS